MQTSKNPTAVNSVQNLEMELLQLEQNIKRLCQKGQ